MLTIIDYGASNLRSVVNAFEAIGHSARVTTDPRDLKDAPAIVLPGVGAFGDGMKNLRKLNFIEALNEEVIGKGKPYLGICLGMQFLGKESPEDGQHQGLGWLPGTVKKITPCDRSYKVPHMGWNNVAIERDCDLFSGLGPDPVFYFVHSYHLKIDEASPEAVTSTCWHGTKVISSIRYGNIMAVQFHPEKSQQAGLQLLKNFVDAV